MNDEITTIKNTVDAPIKIFLFSFLKWLDMYFNDDCNMPKLLVLYTFDFCFM